MTFERAPFRKLKSTLVFVTGSVLFLFAAYQLYTSVPRYNRAPEPSRPIDSTVPACEIWPSWRTAIPSSIPADDLALSSLRLGTVEVMSGTTDQCCTPAEERLGFFGHSSGKSQRDHPPWNTVRWGQLQSSCANKLYGSGDANLTMPQRRLARFSSQIDENGHSSTLQDRSTHRTAVVLRTWDAYQYSGNQLAWMRAMMTELSLDTGGRFQVFMLVVVNDNSLVLFDDDTYAHILEKSVPEEFRDLTLLYNEPFLREWCPKVGVYSAQDQMYQALQIFSHSFPEFDFVWQLEMDARFTSNVAKMLTSAGSWANRQPRKNLWERNGRWFIPALWKDYASFSAHVD
jgi:hypothetical protein